MTMTITITSPATHIKHALTARCFARIAANVGVLSSTAAKLRRALVRLVRLLQSKVAFCYQARECASKTAM